MSFCPQCGAQNLDDAQFCTGCGAPLPSSQATQPQPAYQQPMMPEDPANLIGQTYEGPVTVTFSQSMLCFWVKGSVSCDRLAIQTNLKNTVLGGLIPAGSNNQRIPMGNISAAFVNTSYKVGRMIMGALVCLLAFLLLGTNVLVALVAAVVGVCLIGSGIQTVLTLQRMGSDFDIVFPFFEKEQALLLNDTIQGLLVLRQAETNNNLTTYAQTNTLLQANAAETDRLLRGLQQQAAN